MKPKHENCINCGANEYKAIPNGFKCEYCGTEYENEKTQPIEWIVEPSPFTTCFTGVVQHTMQNTGKHLRKFRL